MMNNDAIDESNLVLCCALCCANISISSGCDCIGCSGKAGILCCNLEFCCKPGAPCLCPCCCCGIKPECDGPSCVNAQCQCGCAVVTAAIPCNDEVPLAVSILGLTIFPVIGCFIKQKEIMVRR